MNDDSAEWIGWGSAGAAAAIGLGGLLVTVRDRIGNTNVALILVVVIVTAASLGGRRAAVLTAGAACLSFNFFHSQPLYTLRVHSDNDIWTIVLLFVIGLVVGQVSRFAHLQQSQTIIEHKGVAHLEEVSAMVAENKPPSEIWPTVQAALVDELGLVDATFESGDVAATPISQLDRNGRFDNKVMFWSRGQGMELPRDGIALPVDAGVRSFGRIVMSPRHGHGTTPDQRRVAVALADLLAITYDRHQPVDH
jgi:K+-sensing histidine kinase KdpD